MSRYGKDNHPQNVTDPQGEGSKICCSRNLIEHCLKNPMMENASRSDQNSQRYCHLKLRNTQDCFEF